MSSKLCAPDYLQNTFRCANVFEDVRTVKCYRAIDAGLCRITKTETKSDQAG